jgi:stage III sporulation protein AA
MRQEEKNLRETFANTPIIDILPEKLRKIVLGIPAGQAQYAEEIRVREGRPLMIHGGGGEYFVRPDGLPTSIQDEGYIVTRQDASMLLQLLSNYSIYAVEEELRNGYVTVKGGGRVGLVGRVVLEDGRIKTLKNINSFNIRIPREVTGAADKVIPYITVSGVVMNSIILSPPQMGKTTLIRDVARQLSDGFSKFRGVKVSIVDERSEIAGCLNGVPQNRVGVRTDVLDACPKAAGIMMLIRSMSPEVIITDEIGRAEDVAAVLEAMNSGVKIITTAHSSGMDDARYRPILSKLLEEKVFERIVILGNSLGVGTLESIYDGRTLKELLSKPLR